MSRFEETCVPAEVRFAEPNPLANCFKTGTIADIPRVAEDVRAVDERTVEWYQAFSPQNHYHCWLIDQVSLASIRIEHNNRIERRVRDRAALRARLFWDDDRRLEAEILGEALAKAPVLVVNKLRRTPQGCDWMIDRWARLARIADLAKQANSPKIWDEAQTSLAWDLLGTRTEDRIGQIGEVIDQFGEVISAPSHLADLARREIAGLLKRKDEVAGMDTLDRAMAEADYVAIASPEIHQIRRRNNELHRHLKWYIGQGQAKPAYPYARPAVYDYFRRGTEVETPRQSQPSPASSVPARAATSESALPIPGPRLTNSETDENGKTWPYLIAARRDAEDLKKQAQEEARREKRMRRRQRA